MAFTPSSGFVGTNRHLVGRFHVETILQRVRTAHKRSYGSFITFIKPVLLRDGQAEGKDRTVGWLTGDGQAAVMRFNDRSAN
jgi:hypothetical protein